MSQTVGLVDQADRTMDVSVASAARSPKEATTLTVVRSIGDLREAVRGWRREGLTVALVPTMGAIHEGHISLVRTAFGRCDRVIVSLFVNPTQFGPNEDIATYPANEAKDAARLAEAGVDLLFAPLAGEIYPEGFATTVTVSGLTDGLCGRFRPGHFAGVATVVTKLLVQAAPDVAIFGEKDFQQLQVIRRLARDLDLPVEIVGSPTVRDADGLALSSRNAYLSPEERAIAPALYRTLSAVAERVSDGTFSCEEACRQAERDLLAAGFRSVDYVAVCDAETLQPLDRVDRSARVLGAARLGKARLIDNLGVRG